MNFRGRVICLVKYLLYLKFLYTITITIQPQVGTLFTSFIVIINGFYIFKSIVKFLYK